MGQMIGRKSKKNDDEYFNRFGYILSNMVLITEVDATVNISEIWSALDLHDDDPVVVEKFFARDRYRRNRRKVVVVFVDSCVARRFVSDYHNLYLYNKLIRVYHLEDHVKEILKLQLMLMNPEFQRMSSQSQHSSENTSLSVTFSGPPTNYEEFALKLFGDFGNLLSIKKYRRINAPDIIVQLKFSLFAEAFAAYVTYDGRIVDNTKITVSMDKNPYYYIMYLEGKHVNHSFTASSASIGKFK